MLTRNFHIKPEIDSFNSRKVAKESMDKATSELGEKLSVDAKSKYFKAVASYDGCYQLRSGKGGGILEVLLCSGYFGGYRKSPFLRTRMQ